MIMTFTIWTMGMNDVKMMRQLQSDFSQEPRAN